MTTALYQYRHLRAADIPEERVWAILGFEVSEQPDNQYYRTVYGFLEYCDGEADAQDRLEKMRQYPRQFSSLRALPMKDFDQIGAA